MAVVLIDPNEIDGQKVPKYEEMFLFVELKAIRKEFTNLNNGQSSGTVVVGLMGYDQNTGEYSTRYTFNTLSPGEKDKNAFEGFGITNINIKVNASQVPMVDITFVDTRGAQFFNRADSPYRILFDFPPPNYELTVKGYYGKGLTYKLHYVNSNNSFDYKTGNYTINAQFQAITFAPLADIPLAYLLADPFFDNTDNVVASLENGEPPRNTFELIAKAKRLYEKIDGLKNNSEDAKAIEEKTASNFVVENGLETVNKSFFNVTNDQFKNIQIQGVGDSTSVTITGEVTTEIQTYPYNIARYFYDFQSSANEQNVTFINALKSAVGQIRTIEALTTTFKAVQVSYFTSQEDFNQAPISQESLESFLAPVSLITPDSLKTRGVERIEFNIKPLIDFIKAEKEKNDNLIREAENKIAEEATKVLTDYFGTMRPTIGNIMKILCDDADRVFIRLNDVAIEAREHHRTFRQNILARASAINNFNLRTEEADIFPFPYYVSKDSNTTDGQITPRTSVRGWIGKAFSDPNIPVFPEVKFVEDYIRATFRQKDQQETIEQLEDTDAEGNATWFPLAPFDYTNITATIPDLKDNPYLNKKSSEEIMRTLVDRLLSYEAAFYGGLKNDVLSKIRIELVKIEASNIGAGITDDRLLERLTNPETIAGNIRDAVTAVTTSSVPLPRAEASEKIQLLPQIDSSFLTPYTNEDNRGNINTIVETFKQKGGVFSSDVALGVEFSKRKLFYFDLPTLQKDTDERLIKIANYTNRIVITSLVEGFLINLQPLVNGGAAIKPTYVELIDHLDLSGKNFGNNLDNSDNLSLKYLKVLTAIPCVLVANKLIVVYLYATLIKEVNQKLGIILETKATIVENRTKIFDIGFNPYTLEIFFDVFDEFRKKIDTLLNDNDFITEIKKPAGLGSTPPFRGGANIGESVITPLKNTEFYKFCIERVIIYSPSNQSVRVGFGGENGKMIDRFRTGLVGIEGSPLSSFIGTIVSTVKENSQKQQKEIQDKRVEREQFIKNNDIKQRLYQGFKSLYDRWLIGTKQGRGQVHEFFGSSLYDCFKFVDRGNNDISQECFISLQPLLNFENNPDVSLFTVISQLLSYNGFEFFPIQNFMGFQNQEWLESFRVTPTLSNIVTRPTFVCMYMGGASNFLDNPNSLFKNDGFALGEPETPEDISGGSATVNAFVVSYGKQNQSYFKDIQTSSTEHRETNESLQILSTLARDTSNTAPEPVGQNLYQIYEQRSYTATIEMLGNVMIQPTMYFDLRNVPLYSGAYMVIEVEHNIVPNYMNTKFKGVRLAKFPQPFVSNFTASVGLSANSTFSSDESGVVDIGGGGGFARIDYDANFPTANGLGVIQHPLKNNFIRTYTQTDFVETWEQFTAKTQITKEQWFSGASLTYGSKSKPPVRKVTRGFGINSPFGYRDFSGLQLHPGLDFLPNGTQTPVFPVLEGVVFAAGVYSGYSGYGRIVIVRHIVNNESEFDYWTLYAHLAKVLVRPGQAVTLDTPLGIVGGSSSNIRAEVNDAGYGIHLHFELARLPKNINEFLVYSGRGNIKYFLDPQPFIIGDATLPGFKPKQEFGEGGRALGGSNISINGIGGIDGGGEKNTQTQDLDILIEGTRVIVNYPKESKDIKANLLVLPGFGFPVTSISNRTPNKTLFDSYIKEGFVVIQVDMKSSVYGKKGNRLIKNPPDLATLETRIIRELQTKYGLFNDKNFVIGVSTGGRGAAALIYNTGLPITAAASLSGDFDYVDRTVGEYQAALKYYGNATDLIEDDFVLKAKRFGLRSPMYIGYGNGVSDTYYRNQSKKFIANVSEKNKINEVQKQGGHEASQWELHIPDVLNYFKKFL